MVGLQEPSGARAAREDLELWTCPHPRAPLWAMPSACRNPAVQFQGPGAPTAVRSWRGAQLGSVATAGRLWHVPSRGAEPRPPAPAGRSRWPAHLGAGLACGRRQRRGGRSPRVVAAVPGFPAEGGSCVMLALSLHGLTALCRCQLPRRHCEARPAWLRNPLLPESWGCARVPPPPPP